MTKRRYWTVDAFTRERYHGNPAAVVFDAEGLSQSEMQTIAREMNLSETIFVLPPTEPSADYWSRIFTPQHELPFAGHPTLATAYAMFTSNRAKPRNGDNVLRQQCGIGVVPVEIQEEGDDMRFLMTQGKPKYREAGVDRDLAASMLGCDPADIGDTPVEIVSTGLWWMIAPVRSLEAMASLSPDQRLIEKACRAREAIGVTTFCPEAAGADASYRIRSFAPGEGVPEDPVCGSGNGSTAAYLAKHRYPNESSFAYTSEQGVEMERDGQVFVQCERDANGNLTVRVGGNAVQVMEGELYA